MKRQDDHASPREVDAVVSTGDQPALQAALDGPDEVLDGPEPSKIVHALAHAVNHGPLPLVRIFPKIGAHTKHEHLDGLPPPSRRSRGVPYRSLTSSRHPSSLPSPRA